MGFLAHGELGLAERIAELDWRRIAEELDGYGVATTGLPLLTAEECAALAALYAQEEGFRSRVVMARHGYGQGEYRYFADPLPPLVAALREGLYPRLVPTANRWAGLLGEASRFPDTHAEFRAACHAAGQRRPTPLLLRYGAGDYNRLHQDLYGEIAFPLQVVLLLSVPGRDFTGGEFVMTEQRARMQSRAEVVALSPGEAAIFAVRHRPVAGARGGHGRAVLRHGVSRIHWGQRTTLGIIFHDAA